MIGWNSPLLDLACDFIWDRFQANSIIDCSSATIVFPGSRALRRFREKLALRAQNEKKALFLPELITVGALPEYLIDQKVDVAPPLVLEKAWFEAFKQLSPEDKKTIVPALSSDAKFSEARFFSEHLTRLRDTVSAGAFLFKDVVEKVSLPEEQARWEILAKLENHYLEYLTKNHISDKHALRFDALKQGMFETSQQIFLVGVTDMPSITRKFLEKAHKVTALVGAPVEFAKSFNAFGEVKSSAYQDFAPEVSEVTVAVDHQALGKELLIKVMNEASHASCGYDSCSVGVPRAELAWSLKSGAAELHVPLHIAGEKTYSAAASFILLELLIRYYTSNKTKDFFFLVRHPLLRSWIKMGNEGFNRMLLHSAKYWSECLPEYLSAQAPHRQEEGETIFALQNKLHSEFGEKLPSSPLHALRWAVDTLKAIVPLDAADDEESKEFIGKLIEVHRQYELYGASLFPEVENKEFLVSVLQELGAQTLGGESPHAVEVVGWLELLHDDASYIAITGFEEGNVPDAINNDVFLPNGVRAALDLTDNEKRKARDSFVLRNLLESRKKVFVGVAQQSSNGDILFPSQLLFLSGDTKAKAARLKEYLAPRSVIRNIQQPETVLFSPVEFKPFHPKSLPISSFKMFLTTPEEFYLRYVERLSDVDDTATDLGPDIAGTFLHRVYERGGMESKDVSDARKLSDIYKGIYLEESRRQFGAATLPSVKLQLEMFWSRIAMVIAQEAIWRGEGWVCKEVEKEIPQDFEINVDGEPVVIRGTIDRIDFNQALNTWCLLDYKTGKTESSVNKQYRNKKGDTWYDLQLPLYYHAFLHELGAYRNFTEVKVGLIRLPTKRNEGELFSIAEWSRTDFADAFEVAKECIRKMRRGEFKSTDTTLSIYPSLAPLFEEAAQ